MKTLGDRLNGNSQAIPASTTIATEYQDITRQNAKLATQISGTGRKLIILSEARRRRIGWIFLKSKKGSHFGGMHG
jgi:hypothetical protein